MTISERKTPIGSPVVIAPGRIPLLGEHLVGGEGVAVIAAITRYARAQFIPRADAMPDLVADVVRRTGEQLGEISAALPLGSVVLEDGDLQGGGLVLELGCRAATAVATVGALLETLGLPIEAQRPLILSIAEAARTHGSGAGSLAATHGGLVHVAREGGHARASLVSAPSGLHLVMFAGGPTLPFTQVVDGIASYAACDAADYERRSGVLRGLVQRFVDEARAATSTGAVWAAGKYADELVELGKAAGIAVASPPFIMAAQLAHELGGMAKPTGAADGGVGVAMFATAEAAELFRRALPQGLSILDGDLDHLGVRCAGAAERFDEGPTEISAFPMGAQVGGPTESAAVESAPTEAKGTLDLAAREQLTLRLGSMALADPNPTVPVGPLYRLRRWLLPAAGATLALVVAAWLALSAHGRAQPRHAGAARPAEVLPKASLPAPPVPVAVAPAAPRAAGEAEATSSPDPSPAPVAILPVPPPPAAGSEGHSAAVADVPASEPLDGAARPVAHLAKRRAHGEPRRPSSSTPGQPARTPSESGVSATPRAGRLSSDDF